MKAKTNYLAKKASKGSRSVRFNILGLKESMLVNKVEFLKKTVFFLVIPEGI